MATTDDVPEDNILPSNYVQIPLEALNHSGRRQIELYLNLDGTINDETGLLNNYQGLAEKIGFGYLEISNFELQRSPTEQVLREWTSRKDLSPTIGALWEYLKDLERFDVLTDVWKFIKRDCDKYLAMKAKFASTSKPIQDQTVSQSASEKDVDDGRILAVQDVDSFGPTMYDAFVCYNPEGSDLDFVRLLIEEVEVKNGLKLFVPWRDDLPGASHNTVCAKLIEQRCKRMIIVLSPQYLLSSACEFQTKFAHGLAPGSRDKKLIPVLIEECSIPEILRHITCCNYTKKTLIDWFWNRLVKSLKANLNPSECKSSNTAKLSEIKLDTSSQVPGWSTYSSTYSSTSDSTYNSSTGSSVGYSRASDNGTTSSESDYLRPADVPPYLELLADSPELPRKSNNYERLSNIQRERKKPEAQGNTQVKGMVLYEGNENDTRSASSLSPNSGTSGRDSQKSNRISPNIRRRPVPPIPTEKPKQESEPKEYFC
ncbi:Myeloid differentiation primary response protein MyD88 [Mactra antiquata]